ncbi:hypothetical protein GZ77_08100 [Endozoicomonas montiporae]|uniref:Type II secretion system protein L n=2 Tax=Endozoicomonas montiporae TaxID=1027273 RepID=A0A081N7C0_9GAMM|nr:type II secretion system protein GspL [Endozoicomonas montiporae]AMO55819.1 general secretion pathway protein L [Endozoicomonas montiporae CL-33]KEQ14343.1 hypothetical protein GZ77_08100 [Endozoicomonas montiporae]
MKSILLIRIHPATAAISGSSLTQWGIFSGQGELQGDVHVSELGTVKRDYLSVKGLETDQNALAEEDYLPDQVTLLLPGSLAFHRFLPINSGQRKHLNTALPYMLEEDLAEDVDTLHLASQLSSDKEKVSVSGFSHKQFQALLDSLDEQGLSVDSTLAETQLLETEAGQVALLMESQSVTVRMPDQAANHLDYDALRFVLEGLNRSGNDGDIVQSPDLETEIPAITSIKVFYPEDSFAPGDDKFEQVRSWLNEQGWLVEEEGLNTSVFEHFVSLYFNRRKNIRSALVDLRTGAYQCPRRASRRLRKWKPMALIASLWLMLEMGLMVGEGVTFQHEAAQFWDKSASLYLEVFPQDQQVREALESEHRSVNVKSRMESRLKTAGTHPASKPFLPLLKKVSAVSASLPEARIKPVSMDFNDTTGNLVLELRAESLESVNKLLAATKSAGLMAKLDSANQEKNGVNARMTISR